MTTLNTYLAEYDRQCAEAEAWEIECPEWETLETDPEDRRYVSEWDMPVEDIDDDYVSDADWAAWLEMTYVDPAERAY